MMTIEERFPKRDRLSVMAVLQLEGHTIQKNHIPDDFIDKVLKYHKVLEELEQDLVTESEKKEDKLIEDISTSSMTNFVYSKLPLSVQMLLNKEHLETLIDEYIDEII